MRLASIAALCAAIRNRSPGSWWSRSLAILPSLLAASALADTTPVPARAVRQQTPAVNLTPIVLGELPEKCKPIARQAGAPDLAVALAGRIALANCRAIEATASLQLCDCADSIVAIDDAIAPSIELLDEVIAAGDPRMQILGEAAKAELYGGLRIRMAATIPSGDGNPDSVALRDSRKAMLEAQLAPWDETIKAASEHVVDLVKANPTLEKNPSVKPAIEASRRRLAPAVATQP